MTLRIAAPVPFAHCHQWGLRGHANEPEHGARCCHCDREVAAPESARGKLVACIYCGMDRGEIPCEEIEPFTTAARMPPTLRHYAHDDGDDDDACPLEEDAK